MDPTEDVSTRVLLQHILRTEPLRTPVTRSVSKAQHRILTRSASSRAKDGRAQTPQDIIKRSMKQKMRESISRLSLPPTKRTASAMLKKANASSSSSVSFDEADTPSHLLMKILHTEPTKSPAVHEETAPTAPQLPSANSSKHSSTELSGLDLPNVTDDIAVPVSVPKGLQRKRPRRSFSVTAFEERLKEGRDDGENEEDQSARDDFSLSLSNATSLSLKTPIVNEQTERKGLRRRVSYRQRVTEYEFADAVNKMHVDHGASSFVQGKPGLSETAHGEGLSRCGEQELTTDIIHCNTALYDQPDDISPPERSVVAAQDKAAVLASPLQTVPEQDGQKQPDAGRQHLEVSDSQEKKTAVISQSEGEGDAAGLEAEEEDEDSPPEEEEGETPPEEGEAAMASQVEEADVDSESEGVVDSQAEEDDVAQEEEEEGADEDEEERDYVMEHVERDDDDMEAGRSEVMNRTRRASDFHGLDVGGDHSSNPVQGDAGDVNSLHLLEASNGEEKRKLLDEAEDTCEEEEDCDDEDAEKMPAFVREKRKTFQLPYPPTVLKPPASVTTPTEDVPAAKPKRVRKRRSGAAAQQRDVGLPKSYLMSTFRHFAKTRVSADVYPVLRDTMEKFLERMAEDLETFVIHAGRKTIEVEDAVLLLRRQRHVNDKVPVEVLIEKYLRMEQRKLLIPVATSGNVIVPKIKR